MVSKYGEVELIDFGGTSPIGRSVKQFTEWHDRGFWNAGSRISDEGYDLFAFAVLCLRLLNEEGLKKAALQLPQTRSVDELFKLARNLPNKKLSSWICMALKGGSQALRMLLRSGETIFITRAESARIVWTPLGG